MAEYIELETAIEAIISEPTDAHYPSWYTEKIKQIPAADVAPVVHGKWEKSRKYKGYCSCSLCHDCYIEPEWVENLKWKYCPNCGAKMDGDGNG